MTSDIPAYLASLPEFPSFAFGEKDVDGLIPACRVVGWRGFQQAIDHDFFNRPNTNLVYRGHRRHEWSLTPTLGRYTPSGVIHPKQAETQLDEFRYALRGRGASFPEDEDANELWAYGQHHGLATPLLDWTESPFVALFFACCDSDGEHERPNPSRPIFVINETALSALDDKLFVQPMRNDHTRLIHQAGLFTLSPIGEKTLLTHVMDLLTTSNIDLYDAVRTTALTGEMQDPNKLAQYICKIHIPNDDITRSQCLRALRLMNIHHGTLFPDAIGASLYCNTWFGSKFVDEQPAATIPSPVAEPSEPDIDEQEEHPLPHHASGTSRSVIDASFIAAKLTALNTEMAQVAADSLGSSIAGTIDEHAGPDWHMRETAKADLRVRVKKLLRAVGWDEKQAAATAKALIDELAKLAAVEKEDA